MTTRRDFLTTGPLAAAALLGTPWLLHAEEWSRLGLTPPPQHDGSDGEPDLKALAHQALDAAKAAGASYADVRFTVTRTRSFTETGSPYVIRSVAVGVRALTNGRWGFTSNTKLSPDSMGWLGRTAAMIGKMNAWPNCPPVELGDRPPVATGHWQMPVKRDPFTVSDTEVRNLIQEIVQAAKKQSASCALAFNFTCQDRTFASTDESFATQTIFTTFAQNGRLGNSHLEVATRDGKGLYNPLYVSPCGMGFEACEPILAFMPEWIQIAKDAAGATPLDSLGRFDVVFDAYAMAGLVNTTGMALESDRALGYEADGEGVSYLSPVEKMLGTKQFPTGVTITSDPMLAGGAATVKWDDEGVIPSSYPLIADGTIVNYTTSREFASELATHKQPVQSLGCARAESALAFPLVQTPNLRLQPGPKDLNVEDLCGGIKNGFAIMGGKDLLLDQQLLTASGGSDAVIYKIKDGKFAGTVKKASFRVRMPELWQNLVSLGGERSAATRGFAVVKGKPLQRTTHSVRAVAARFQDVIIRRLDF